MWQITKQMETYMYLLYILNCIISLIQLIAKYINSN